MGSKYRAGWVLVGGRAAWVHIAQASQEMNGVMCVYRDIFPKDIEVVTIAVHIEEVEGAPMQRAAYLTSFGPLQVRNLTLLYFLGREEK
jgi:hypothetical protein